MQHASLHIRTGSRKSIARKNALGRGARVAQPVDTEIEMRTLAYGIAGLGHGWGTLNYFTFGCLPDYVVR